MNIKKYFLTKNRCYTNNVKRTPIGLQLHTIGTAQGTAQSVADYWNSPNVSACVTYIVGADKENDVLQCLPEDVYSWADGVYGNRNLITFEICESDYMDYEEGTANYTVLNESKFKADILRGYRNAVKLCADICKRYGWNPTDKLQNGLYLISSHNEGRKAGTSTSHVDPDHVWSRFGLSMDGFRADVKKEMNALSIETLTGSMLTGTEAERIKMVAPLYQQCQKDTGMLASVGIAQFCLESGYGTTDLAVKANNLHGMKANLSGNTWAGSTWDGKSTYGKNSPEQDSAGNQTMKWSEFRKYDTLKQSVYDRAAYFKGAMNGINSRYPDISEITDYVQQIRLIKAGGYATDMNYVNKLLDLVDRWKLYEYDLQPGDILPETEKPWYRVRKSWDDAGSQIGAFHNVEKAKDLADKLSVSGIIYSVYDDSGNVVYMPDAKVQYIVQAGLFRKKKNARKLFDKIKAAGFDVRIKKINGQYRVQCGIFNIKKNAEKIIAKLKENGFNAVIK